MSRDVREKYREVFEAVEAVQPGCRPEVVVEIIALFVRLVSTCGSVGHEPTRESPWDRPPERRPSPTAGDGPVSPPRPPTPEDQAPRRGCWNCGSGGHLSRDCPRGMDRDYCFRCGTRGYTVRTCPYCRPGWLAQGPYVPGRGHQGPDPPRGRRARDGALPGSPP